MAFGYPKDLNTVKQRIGIVVASVCALAVAARGSGGQTALTETSTAEPVASSIPMPLLEPALIPVPEPLPPISMDIERLVDFSSPEACTMRVPDDIHIGEVSQVPDSVLLKAIVPTYDAGSGTALVRSSQIDACNGAVAYSKIKEEEKSDSCPAAGEMGSLCNPVRFHLKDGRLAVWVYTSISSYSSVAEQSGFLAIVALRDKKGISCIRSGLNWIGRGIV